MQFCGSRWNSNLRTVFRLFFSVNFSILAHSAQCTCPEILYTKISCDIKTCSIVFLHWSDTHIFHWKYSMACQHYHWWDKMGHLCWKTALESNCTWASILLAIANFHSFLWSFGSILNLLNEKKKHDKNHRNYSFELTCWPLLGSDRFRQHWLTLQHNNYPKFTT